MNQNLSTGGSPCPEPAKEVPELLLLEHSIPADPPPNPLATQLSRPDQLLLEVIASAYKHEVTELEPGRYLINHFLPPGEIERFAPSIYKPKPDRRHNPSRIKTYSVGYTHPNYFKDIIYEVFDELPRPQATATPLPPAPAGKPMQFVVSKTVQTYVRLPTGLYDSLMRVYDNGNE